MVTTGSGDMRRLADLLVDPHETLEIELKGWIDIVNNNDHKATLAKAIIALANHGGGFVVIGFAETERGMAQAEDRPENLAGYTPDTVNAVVLGYAEPSFHCDVSVVEAATGQLFPVITVPGGHRVPIKSKRDAQNGHSIKINNYYVRRPGPKSEPPQNGAEWDALIRRCITNGRDDLIDQIRGLLTGTRAIETPPTELDTVTHWMEDSLVRWREVIADSPNTSTARLLHGHFSISYQLLGNLNQLRGHELVEALRRATVRHTGWPEFWVPSVRGLAPYVQDGMIECWMAHDGEQRGSAHSDFWRASPAGKLFLIRGYQEDEPERLQGVTPGTKFDITLPTWRVGEGLLHAANMAKEFGDQNAQVTIIVEWTGLNGRELTHLEGRRLVFDGQASRQDKFRTNLTVQADTISDTLPELVQRLVSPLYELFGFFVLPTSLVIEELGRMRTNRLPV